MLPFNEALSRLLATVTPLGAERVPLENATARVLAEEVVAREPMPRFDHSAMDGYAIRVADVAARRQARLPIRGESAAGGSPPALEPGAACRIFTGAPLPVGADTVVPQEDVARHGDVIVLSTLPSLGAWIRRRGEDLASGAVAIARGTRLMPGHVALAAAADRPTLLVGRRPVVSILSSGDELRSPGDAQHPESIPESNGYFVSMTARRAGATTRVAP